jgi:hypothetical protein
MLIRASLFYMISTMPGSLLDLYSFMMSYAVYIDETIEYDDACPLSI